MPWEKGKGKYDEWEFTPRWKNKKLESAINELLGWLPSEQIEYQEFIMNLLGALPGGDMAADAGYDKFEQFLGWKEMDMAANLLDAIQTREDVEDAVEAFFGPPEDEDY